MQVYVILAVAMTCVAGAWGYFNCPYPPRLWCSSLEVAEACRVTETCKRTEWLPALKSAPLVNLTLYYESLCPDCRNFIKTQLYPTFVKIGGIFNLTLVPYGNAEEKRVGDKWVFDCQHGRLECEENLIDTCLLKIVNNITVTFPFIHCMELSDAKPMEAFRNCSQQFPQIPVEEVEKCTKSPQGNMWEHEMAMKTDALRPAHQYVPWVTLNGVHTEKMEKEAESNLLKLICDAYTGPKPEACEEKPVKKRCTKK